MMDGWMDQCIDGWIDQMIYKMMDRWIDRWIDRCIDRWIDGLMVRWFDGSMVRWINLLEALQKAERVRECVCEIESEDFFIVGGRSTPFEISQMVRNVNVKVDSCFTLSCELVGRLPNLKRWKLSTADMPGR